MFLLVPGCLAAFLGKWQWERRQWKVELLERRERMMRVGWGLGHLGGCCVEPGGVRLDDGPLSVVCSIDSLPSILCLHVAPHLFATGLQGAPLDLFSADQAPEEYAPVTVEGEFDHGASQYVGPRTRKIGGASKQVGGWLRRDAVLAAAGAAERHGVFVPACLPATSPLLPITASPPLASTRPAASPGRASS